MGLTFCNRIFVHALLASVDEYSSKSLWSWRASGSKMARSWLSQRQIDVQLPCERVRRMNTLDYKLLKAALMVSLVRLHVSKALLSSSSAFIASVGVMRCGDWVHGLHIATMTEVMREDISLSFVMFVKSWVVTLVCVWREIVDCAVLACRQFWRLPSSVCFHPQRIPLYTIIIWYYNV